MLEQLFVSCRVTCVKRVTKCTFQSLKSETIVYITWVLNRRLALLLWNAAMPRLDPAARNVIGRLQTRQSQTEVARQVDVHQSTISRLFQRLNQTSQRSAQYRSRSGRSLITTPAQDRYIRIFHLLQPLLLVSQVYVEIPPRQSVTGFAKAEFNQEDLMLDQFLTQEHRRARVIHLRVWTLRNWRRIWFSDESRFLLKRCDGRTLVYRRQNERFAPAYVQKVDRFGGGSVMMSTAISYNRTNLVLVQGNLTAEPRILGWTLYRRYFGRCFSRTKPGPIQQG